jgi:cellulose synthase/poly-beta-1,6-N-acetylglucosamine synthase-like glycosyltransferase
MYLIDYMFLAFAFITLYLVILFMVIFVRNRVSMFDHTPSEKPPSVSVIIPAHNEEEHITETIKAVKNLSYPKGLLEIFVIDDGSTDKTAERAKAEGVKVITKKNSGKASALNLGIEKAKGDIVGCIDADSYPEKEALLKMVPYFEDLDVAAVTSSILVKNPRNFLQRLQEMEYILIAWGRKLLDYLHSVYVTPGPLSLYRKDTLKKIGGFDEKVLTEDIEIGFRLQRRGYKIRMALPARVYTHVPGSFRKWWDQRLRWDIGGIQTANIYKYATFRKSYGVFGLFIVPFFSISIFISLLGFGLFLYLISMRIFNILEFFYYAYLAGIDPLRYYPLTLLPNVFTVIGLLVFLLSLIYLISGLKTMDRDFLNFKTFFEMLIYLSIYLFLFPILLVQSFWRLIIYKEQKW